ARAEDNTRQQIAALHIGAKREISLPALGPGRWEQALAQTADLGIVRRQVGSEDGGQDEEQDDDAAGERHRMARQLAQELGQAMPANGDPLLPGMGPA